MGDQAISFVRFYHISLHSRLGTPYRQCDSQALCAHAPELTNGLQHTERRFSDLTKFGERFMIFLKHLQRSRFVSRLEFT